MALRFRFRQEWPAFVAALLLGLSRSAAADAPEACHEEGKDVVCGRYQATVARLLAADQAALAEADTDSDVTHCRLDVALDPATRIVSGTNAVTAMSRTNGLATFTLDLRDNMIVDGVTMGAAAVSFTRPGHTIEIALDRPYHAGESFEVVVAYHGSPQNLGYGSFTWNTHGSPATAIVSTLSEPWYAHTWWPCKDSLGDKFTAEIWVTVPGGLVVASNGLLQGTDAMSGGRVRYRWHETYPIAAYLVSLAATNYVTWTEYYDHAGGSMPVQFFAYPESEAAVRSGTADLITQIATYSRADVFGEYPFVNEKYGIAQFPWSGGMEHQTITSQGVFSSWLNVHELAHQWWGDMITCATWHDIWLNEGFATWAEAVYQEKRPGGTLGDYQSWMRNNRWPSDSSGTVYVTDATSLSALFSSNTVYRKGAWVLHMLRRVLGDETMFAVLAAYRAAFEGGSATTADFRAVAEAVSGRDLAWFFSEWVYGSGAPSYQWGWRQEQIGSQRYVRLHIQQFQTAYPVFTMPIDITITTGAGVETRSVWNQAAWQWYLLPVDAVVTNVQFDRDYWILRNASNAVPYVDGPPKLVATGPAPGAILARAPATSSISLGFSEAVSFATADFAVVGQRAGAQAATVGYDSATHTVTLAFAGGLPAADTYTVTVRDAVQSMAAGLSLDGEMSSPATPAALPSGDGQPGGNAVFRFTIAATGDFDLDGDVDLADFGLFQACFNGPNQPPPACNADADFDGDADVDLVDFGAFQACFNGPNRPYACP